MLSYQEHKRNLLVEEINNAKGLNSLSRAIDLLSFDLTNVCVVQEEIKTRTDLLNYVVFEGINKNFCDFLKSHNNNIKAQLENLVQTHENKTQLMLEDNQDIDHIVASVEKDFDDFIQTIEKIDPVDYINQIKVIAQDMMQNAPVDTGAGAIDPNAGTPTPPTPQPAPVAGGAAPTRTPVVPTGKFTSDIEPDELGSSSVPTFSPNAKKATPANQGGGWWNGVKKGLSGMHNMFWKYPIHKLKKFYRGAKDIWQGNFGEGVSLAENLVFIENKFVDGFQKIQQIVMAFKDQLVNQAKAYKKTIIDNIKGVNANLALQKKPVAPVPASPTAAPTSSGTAPVSTPPTASSTTPQPNDAPKDMSPLAVQGRAKRNISPESRAAGIGKRVADAYKKMTFFGSMADAELLKHKDKLFKPGGIGLSRQYRDIADKFEKGVNDNNFGEFKAAMQKQLDLINRTQNYASYVEEAKKGYDEFKQRATALLKGQVTSPDAAVPQTATATPAQAPQPTPPVAQPPEVPKAPPAQPIEAPKSPPVVQAPKAPEVSSAPTKPIETPKPIAKPEKAIGQEQPKANDPNEAVINKIKEMSREGETPIGKGIYSTLKAGIIDQLANMPREDRAFTFAQLLMQNLFAQDADSEYATELAEKMAQHDAVKDYFDIDPIPPRGVIAGELATPLNDILTSFPLEKGTTPY